MDGDIDTGRDDVGFLHQLAVRQLVQRVQTDRTLPVRFFHVVYDNLKAEELGMSTHTWSGLLNRQADMGQP